MAEKDQAHPTEAAAEGKSEERQSNNWWDSWLTSAKTKSAEVYSMVKKDLDEIGSAVKCEASHVFNSTSNVIGKTLKLDEPESPANVMKKSLSTFIGQVSTVLNPEPDDEDDTEVILSSGDTTMLSTYKKELEGLQRVDATFIVPADSAEFDAWRCSIEGADAGIIRPNAAMKRLDASPVLKAQYEKLVPDAVTHEEFWERYLFRVALLQDRLAAAARKQPPPESTSDPVLAHLTLQSETEPIQESPKKVLSGLDSETSEDVSDVDNIDKVITWDEDFVNDVELTEEQQILLLEEYEREMALKKMNKQTPCKDLKNNNSNNKNKTTLTSTPKSTANTTAVDKKNKMSASPKSEAKSDVYGNDLVEDYFGDKDLVKDDSSANSDESWEKVCVGDEVQIV